VLNERAVQPFAQWCVDWLCQVDAADLGAGV
jgi:hypothetical protein